MTRERPVFAHPVERELADLLDSHRIRWRYEPHTFVLARGGRGHVTQAFTPDFYLPDLDYYLECTVARRGLTRVKRRKAEAARFLYGITVEIAYRADFEALARRWSLTRLARTLERCRAAEHAAAGQPRAPVETSSGRISRSQKRTKPAWSGPTWWT